MAAPTMSYRVALTFHPEHKNPARPSGKGVWRVDGCWQDDGPLPLRVSATGRLLISAARAFKVRSRVDPVRLALSAL